jgi:hypothetical protein
MVCADDEAAELEQLVVDTGPFGALYNTSETYPVWSGVQTGLSDRQTGRVASRSRFKPEVRGVKRR